MYRLGIDIGGSHIGMGIYDLETKKLVKKEYYLNNKKSFLIYKNTKKFGSNLKGKIDSFLVDNNYTIESIGIGCPGGTNLNEAVFYGNKHLKLKKMKFKEILKEKGIPIYVENDCNCAAIAAFKKYKNIKDLLMITIGSGTGISIIRNINNKVILEDENLINQLVNLNKTLNNGRYINSLNRLSKEFNKLKGHKYNRYKIFEYLEKNDQETKKLFRKYLISFSLGIRLFCEYTGIFNVCIGGGFSEYNKFYLDELKKLLPNINAFIADDMNDSGIIGAALLPVERNNIGKRFVK